MGKYIPADDAETLFRAFFEDYQKAPPMRRTSVMYDFAEAAGQLVKNAVEIPEEV